MGQGVLWSPSPRLDDESVFNAGAELPINLSELQFMWLAEKYKDYDSVDLGLSQRLWSNGKGRQESFNFVFDAFAGSSRCEHDTCDTSPMSNQFSRLALTCAASVLTNVMKAA